MPRAEEALPGDRPGRAKDNLSGAAAAAELPLRSPEFYREPGIRIGVLVSHIWSRSPGQSGGLTTASAFSRHR